MKTNILSPQLLHKMDAYWRAANYPAEEAGVVSIPVRGPNETKRVDGPFRRLLWDGRQPDWCGSP